MNRARLVTSPHGTLVHFDWLNDGRADDTVRSTSCGRVVPSSWSVETVADGEAVQRVTCLRCAAWARYHHVAELAAAVEMPQLRRDLMATDAANSTTRHAELVALLAPAPAMPEERLATAPSASLGTTLMDRGRAAVRRLEQNRRRGELQRAVAALPRGTGRLC